MLSASFQVDNPKPWQELVSSNVRSPVDSGVSRKAWKFQLEQPHKATWTIDP